MANFILCTLESQLKLYMIFMLCGFPGGSDGKESARNAGDTGSIPRLERSPAESNGLPTPIFLPEEFHGQRSLAGYGPWGHKESDMTEQLTLSLEKLMKIQSS